jgi:hypothetical protein
LALPVTTGRRPVRATDVTCPVVCDHRAGHDAGGDERVVLHRESWRCAGWPLKTPCVVVEFSGKLKLGVALAASAERHEGGHGQEGGREPRCYFAIDHDHYSSNVCAAASSDAAGAHHLSGIAAWTG